MRNLLPALSLFALTQSALAQTPSQVLRLEVGAQQVDGRVYQPHAAKVRVYVGPGRGTEMADAELVQAITFPAAK